MPTTADYQAAAVCRRDRVYATTELRVARVYAALAPFGGRGDVYEVNLDDPIEPDGVLDGAAGDSVCAPSATVIKVVERRIDLRVAREEIAAQVAPEAATAWGFGRRRPYPAPSPARVRGSMYGRPDSPSAPANARQSRTRRS